MSLYKKIRSLSVYQKAEKSAFFKRVPLHICLGLTIAIVLDTAVQIFWKMAVESSAGDTLIAQVFSVFLHPLFWLVVILFLLQLANWLKVLEHADLSYSQPITSLSYISVLVFSAFILHEPIEFLKVAGIALILAGVWFISKSEHNTVPSITGAAPTPVQQDGVK